MTAKSRNWLLIVIAFVFIIGIRAISVHPIESAGYFDARRPLVIALAGASEQSFDLAAASGADAVAVTLSAANRVTVRRTAVREPGLRLNFIVVPDGADEMVAVCALIREVGLAGRTLVHMPARGSTLDFRERCEGVPTSAYWLELAWFQLYRLIGLAAVYQASSHALVVEQEILGFDATSAAFIEDVASTGAHVIFEGQRSAAEITRLTQAGAAGFMTAVPATVLEALGRGPDS